MNINEILFILGSRAEYFFRARHRKGFGIHSPYVFSLLNDVVYERNPYYCYETIENLRQRLLCEHTPFAIKPMGTGTRSETTIAHEVKHSSSQRRYGQLLMRLAVHLKAKNIIELGTNMGLGTLYLASSGAKVFSFEGQKAFVKIARDNFSALGYGNITVEEGNINETLPYLLQKVGKIDMAFIDANHRYEPAKRYYTLLKEKIGNSGIIVIDDPYHSPEMKTFWQEVVADRGVALTLDLFQMGIALFREELPKQHYVVAF